MSIKEEGKGFGPRALDFQAITAQGIFQLFNRTSWTAPGSKDKRHANPATIEGCTLLMSGHRKIKWIKGDSFWPSKRKITSLQKPVCTSTSWIEPLNLSSGPCSEPAESRNTAGEVDCVFTSLMLAAHTQSELMDTAWPYYDQDLVAAVNIRGNVNLKKCTLELFDFIAEYIIHIICLCMELIYFMQPCVVWIIFNHDR